MTFHNGMPLTADDVAYSLNRIRKPPAGIVSPRKGLLGNVTDVTAQGPQTVVVSLAQPQPDFPFLVSNPLQRHLLQESGRAARRRKARA